MARRNLFKSIKRLIQNVYNVKSQRTKETNLTTFAQQAIKEEQELNKLKSKKTSAFRKRTTQTIQKNVKKKKST